MNILITGGAGYIGSEVSKKLVKKFNIYLLVRNSTNIDRVDKESFTVLQYETPSDIIDIFKKNNFNGVIHFASNTIVEHTIDQIEDLFRSNLLFGTYLLEASKETGVKWFLNTGTFWQHYNNEDYNPVNLYASTKEAFENIAKFYTQTSNLIFTTIKLNDTFGPNDKRPKLFNLWKKSMKTSQTLDMSPGSQTIDASYIEDVVSAYEIMIKNLSGKNSTKYNNKSFVVTNQEKPNLIELSKIFESVSGKALPIAWGAREYREREVMSPYSLGLTVPNWKQKFTLKEAIKKTIGDAQDDS